MLNELHRLSATLTSNHIKQQEWHDGYKKLPGGDCYRVWLCSNGEIKNVELMNKDLATNCRKYGNNQHSFPAFNIAPLYRIILEEEKAYFDALTKGKEQLDIERLKLICVNDNWNENLLKKVEGCLHKKIPAMPKESAIFSLMRITEQVNGSKLRDTLETYVWKQLQSDIKKLLPILLHKGNAKKQPKNDTGSLSIMLDLIGGVCQASCRFCQFQITAFAAHSIERTFLEDPPGVLLS
ncbi:MAG TPA: hypothetical protein PK364_10895 [Synergistaceae bacterium]|nr:hypothetical protein [Synergistaceae bacterium]